MLSAFCPVFTANIMVAMIYFSFTYKQVYSGFIARLRRQNLFLVSCGDRLQNAASFQCLSNCKIVVYLFLKFYLWYDWKEKAVQCTITSVDELQGCIVRSVTKSLQHVVFTVWTVDLFDLIFWSWKHDRGLS